MKTALVLSGGGSRGSYQIGVFKALLDMEISIDMVFGSSVGSLNALMIAMGKHEEAEKLWLSIKTSNIFSLDGVKKDLPKGVREIIKKSTLVGMPMEEVFGYAKKLKEGGAAAEGLSKLLDEYIDEPLLRKSDMDFGVVITNMKDGKGEYILKKDMKKGRVKDYVIASSSCYPAAHFYEMNGIRYIDGGYADNMPISMALSKGADRIIAVNLNAVGRVVKKDIKRAEKNCKEFHLIESKWDLGNFLSFDKKVAKRNIQLGYIDCLKSFGLLDGLFYGFKKGTFLEEKNLEFKEDIERFDINNGEFLGKIFSISPEKIYTKRSFNNALKKKIELVIENYNKTFNPLNNSEKKTPKDTLRFIQGLRKNISMESLTVAIAFDISEKGNDSIFLTPQALSLFRGEILAAGYIKKYFI